MRNITRRMLALLICLALVFGTISFAAGEEKTGAENVNGIPNQVQNQKTNQALNQELNQVPNQAIAVFRKALTEEAQAAILRESLGNDFAIEDSLDFGERLTVSLVSSEKYSAGELAERLAANSAVDSAEFNAVLKPQSYSYALNDPYNSYLYYTNASDAGNTVGDAVSDTGAEEVYSLQAGDAWQRIPADAEEVVVAVMDSGVNANHEDLKNVIWTNPGNIGLAGEHGFNYGVNSPDVQDVDGHGTHCSGIIAAEANNGLGIAGVASGAKVKIMMVSTYKNDPGQPDELSSYRELAAFHYILKAKQAGVNIVATSNSWGGGGCSEAYDEVINLLGEEGIVTFVCAGNDGSNLDYRCYSPAGGNSPYQVTVGAADITGRAAGFSNFGKSTVDLFAPGANILSTVSYPCYFPNIWTPEKRSETTAYYGLFDENTVITNGSATPSIADCDGTVKGFGASVFHIQPIEYTGTEEPDGESTEDAPAEEGAAAETAAPEPAAEPEKTAETEPATIEMELVHNHTFTNTEKPTALKVTIHNARPMNEYYLYFPYEKDPATTGSDNTDLSITAIRGYEEGDLPCAMTFGEVIADADGGCSFAGCGYEGSGNGEADSGLMVHLTNAMALDTLLCAAEEAEGKTCGLGLRVSPDSTVDRAGDIHFYLDSIAVSKPGIVLSGDDAYDVMSGTSMATPAAAGAYAVLASLYPRQEGQTGAEYALENKARLFGCVRISEEMKDLCVTGGVLDLSLMAESGTPAITRAEVTDLEEGILTLRGLNLNCGAALNIRRTAQKGAEKVTLPAEGMTAAFAEDGKTIVIHGAQALFGTECEFTLTDESGVRAMHTDFLVKGFTRVEPVLREAYPDTIENRYHILSGRQLMTDMNREKLYAIEADTGVLLAYDGMRFCEYHGTDLKESLLEWLGTRGYTEYDKRHNLELSIQESTNPMATGNTVYAFVKAEYKPWPDAEEDTWRTMNYLAFMDYTAEDPTWSFREIADLTEAFGMFATDSLNFTAMGGNIYCFGSECFEDERDPVPFMFSMNPETCEWTREESLPLNGNRWIVSTREEEGKFYAALGVIHVKIGTEQVSTRIRDVFCFDGEHWTKITELPYLGDNPEINPEGVGYTTRGTFTATEDGLMFLFCPTDGGGNVFRLDPETGDIRIQYLTDSDYKSDDVHYASAAETKDGIWICDDYMEMAYMSMYRLYQLDQDR